MSGEATNSCAEPQAVSFTTLVLSLSTAALQHLGVAVEEGAPAGQPNLPLAQQTIDILDMLEKKTRGNLADEESRLLGTLLYDLRMRYVQAARGAGC